MPTLPAKPYLYPELDSEARDRLVEISVCRKPECLVTQRNPKYHDGVACRPVVPVYATIGKIMIVGDYPTARFVEGGGSSAAFQRSAAS